LQAHIGRVRAAIILRATPNRWVDPNSDISAPMAPGSFQQRNRIGSADNRQPQSTSVNAKRKSYGSVNVRAHGRKCRNNWNKAPKQRRVHFVRKIRRDDHFDIQRGPRGSGSRRCSGVPNRGPTKERLGLRFRQAASPSSSLRNQAVRFRPAETRWRPRRPVRIA